MTNKTPADKLMSCREEFEKMFNLSDGCFDLTRIGEHYKDHSTQYLWAGFHAAYNRTPAPVIAETRCELEAFNVGFECGQQALRCYVEWEASPTMQEYWEDYKNGKITKEGKYVG